ncbi:MAG: DUF4349 domain-containing protein [Planctomycetota bacterium]
MKRHSSLIASFAGLLLLCGCGQVAETSLASKLEMATEQSERGVDGEISLTNGPDSALTSTRKIIYNAEIDLVVEALTEFENALPTLLDTHQAFVAERRTDRRHGDHRHGEWKLRVPVENYRSMMSGLSSLGFAKSKDERTEDVTEAYVDLEARISNKQKLETRLVEMLDERSGKLADLLQLERELARVREEIERMQGRMRVLNDQTSLATIELDVSERQTYEPPAAPGLGDRIAMAWGGSLGSIGGSFSAILVGVVAAIPWAVIAIPFLLFGYRWFRPRTAAIIE